MELSQPSPTRTGYLKGARDAFGPAAAVMTAGFIGFGSLAADAGIPFWIAGLATALMWGLPGQIILVEMFVAKAAFLAIVVAVSMSAARFLPMGMSMMPMMRSERSGGLKKLLVAQFVASTSWALSMRHFLRMPEAERAPWLAGFGTVCTLIGVATTGVGYLLAGAVPQELRVGLVFVTPAYFLLLLFADIRGKVMGVSVMSGAIVGPLAHMVAPQWSVLLGGVVGGSIAYFVLRGLQRHAS